MHPNGKNICINEKGIISVIDFDIATIDNNYKSVLIKGRVVQFGDDYYKNLKQKIINIISKI